MFRALIFSLLAAQALLWAGCHKKPSERSAAPHSSAAAQPVAPTQEPTEAPAPPPSASAPATETAAAAPEAADPNVVQTVANAVQSYTIAHPQGPKSFDDLVKAGYLNNLPSPPAGKKFALNPQNFEVTLVNQ